MKNALILIAVVMMSANAFAEQVSFDTNNRDSVSQAYAVLAKNSMTQRIDSMEKSLDRMSVKDAKIAGVSPEVKSSLEKLKAALQ